MKKPTSKSSKLYSPKSKPSSCWSDGIHMALTTLRHPVLVIGAILAVVIYIGLYHTSGSTQDIHSLRTGKKLYTSSNRDVVLLNLDDVQAATCAEHSRLLNFTTQEYQVELFLDIN